MALLTIINKQYPLLIINNNLLLINISPVYIILITYIYQYNIPYYTEERSVYRGIQVDETKFIVEFIYFKFSSIKWICN